MFPFDTYTSGSRRESGRGIRHLTAMVGSLSVAALALAGCAPTADASGSSVINTTVSEDTSTFFNSDEVHEISVQASDDDLASTIEAYESDQSKEWISATVTIDGTTFNNVGLRLKGNSTLRQADTSDNWEDLPWQIKLDKYVDGQTYSGRASFVVRTNTSETALNEAVALELLGEAGLATEHAAETSFSLNGSDAQLRLVIDNPSDEYYSEETFNGEGITYKADSEGDYSYRGDDPSEYEEAFSVEAGDDDWTPVMEFLDFVNNSSDEDFAADLSSYLDVDQFATYLAMQDLVSNSDDIDGPGNNSFLRYDTDSGTMTVVAWDQNLSFGGMGGGGFGGGQGGGMGGGGQGMGTDAILQQLLPDGMDLDEFTAAIEAGEVPDGVELPDGFELTDGTELIDVLQSLVDGDIPEGLSMQGMGPGGNGGQMPENMTPPTDMQAPGDTDQQAQGEDQGEGQQQNSTDSDGSATDDAADDADTDRRGGPGGQDGGQDGGMGGGPGGMGGNELSERFLANDDFAAQVEQAKTDLTEELYDSGKAEEILDKWTDLLTSEATDLVDADTVSSEADSIRAFFSSDGSASTAQAPGGQEEGTAPREDGDGGSASTPSAPTEASQSAAS